MGNEYLEKSLNKFDNNLNDLVNKLEDNPIETRKIPGVIPKKISKETKYYNVKGFFKWLFTEFF